MKKLVALVAFIGCVMFVAACSSEDVQNATDQAKSSAENIAGNVSTAAGNVQDDAYTKALETQDVKFGDNEKQIAAAQTACDELSGGTSLADTTSKIAGETGLDDSKSKTLINIAIPIYCPVNVGKLAGN